LYVLTQLVPSEKVVAGQLRLAAAEELDLLTGWFVQVGRETSTGSPNDNYRELASRRIHRQLLYVWVRSRRCDLRCVTLELN
jgi:hypothetical protein